MSRYVPVRKPHATQYFPTCHGQEPCLTMTHSCTLIGLGFRIPDRGHTLPRLAAGMVPWNRHPLNNPCWTNSIKRVKELFKILYQEKNLLFQVNSRCDCYLETEPSRWEFLLSFLGKRKLKVESTFYVIGNSNLSVFESEFHCTTLQNIFPKLKNQCPFVFGGTLLKSLLSVQSKFFTIVMICGRT